MSESEAKRLEALWGGDFGDAYVDRNREFAVREPFWTGTIATTRPQRVLEVGCNLGGNLRWIAEMMPAQQVYGVDVNLKALRELRAAVPDVNAVWSPGRDLPFRDGWFDLVFTMGVLIHQPEDTLSLLMAEMVRTSRQWILCGEYYAEKTEEIAYRGHEGALFRRDYGGLFQRLFPELALSDKGFLGRDQGWDDVTWWLFRKSDAA
ncbi:MAG: pseudaminic acid biosynthesis-associated methylase [Acidimicrobiales bacterium]